MKLKLSPAAKAAASATAVIAVIYVIGVIVLNLVVSAHLTEQANDRLAGRLAAALHDPAMLSQPVARPGGPKVTADTDVDADAAPVFLWSVDAAGAVTAHSPGAPALPAGLLGPHGPRDGVAFIASLGSVGGFRLKLARDGGGWLIAGQSLAGDAHTGRLLLYGEVIAGPFLLPARLEADVAALYKAATAQP